ncbi:MAG TPA: peptidylprolyl isomerase [Candidatus Paceibacterota bacterium]|nr:peptidylprolyl isomerase [Candidatus Paceibacterota bacterium]
MHAVGFKTLGGQITAFVALCVFFGASLYYFLTTAFETGIVFAEKNPEIALQETPILYARIHTEEGVFKVRFLRSKAPFTVKNFIRLSKKDFYNETQFHRVIKGFMIQGGDPLTREDDISVYGTGGPGYMIPDEINDRPMVRGAVAMANYGKDTNGSQFFVLTHDTPRIQDKFTIFGEVVEGIEIVDRISSVPVDSKNLPKEPIRIQKIELLEAF